MKKRIFYGITRKNFLTLATLGLCLAIVCISACKKEELVINGPPIQPRLPSVPYQYTNTINNNLTTLGRVLFYDRNLSLNNSIACGSCHIQAHGFADSKQFSVGLNNGLTARNASALINTGNSHTKFWDGRGTTDYTVADFMPVVNHVEMDIFNLNMLPNKLSGLSYYPALFNAAFGTSTITVSEISSALADFTGNLLSSNSRFDRGINSLTADEQLGWRLFNGKALCYNCHNGNNLDGYSSAYENIGLEVNYSDPGRGRITQMSGDVGKFKVPTLRNIALSAPYMHDGRYKTLREVIDHYSEGIQNSPNLSWVFRTGNNINNFDNTSPGSPVRLNLTDEEKKQLEAFLLTLTDVDFVADPRYSNPF
jgi:cytochrome c peroxidase